MITHPLAQACYGIWYLRTASDAMSQSCFGNISSAQFGHIPYHRTKPEKDALLGPKIKRVHKK